MKNYEDIINLPHHKSSRHQPMSMANRAAQFAPFAALTGHDEVIAEAARITSQNREMSDYEKDMLSLKFKNAIEIGCVVTVTYFLPDTRKEGGKFEKFKGRIKHFDEIDGKLYFNDGNNIPLKYIREIESKELENMGL